MRVIEIVAPAKHQDALIDIAERHEAIDFWWGTEAEDGRRSFRILISDENRQQLVDALQSLLAEAGRARILIHPIDAALPRPQPTEAQAQEKPRSASTTREELYHRIEQGAVTDANFFLMVILSTIVAAIGLMEDNVAVIIGAMVIAPLLGPNLAFAFGTALGDKRLMWRSLQAGMSGALVAFALSALIGFLWSDSLHSHEILSRTDVGLDSIALALASGAAAVLSLSSGASTVLVGVMVAVALLPPTAAMGLLAGGGRLEAALGAGLLLAVNVVCVVLSAKLVFLLKGIRPRTWLEKEKARQSMTVYILLWLLLLGLLVVFIVLRGAQVR